MNNSMCHSSQTTTSSKTGLEWRVLCADRHPGWDSEIPLVSDRLQMLVVEPWPGKGYKILLGRYIYHVSTP